MIHSILRSGIWLTLLLLLSACAKDSGTNKTMKVVVGNQWPLIKVVLPAKRIQTVQPVLTTPATMNIPRQANAEPSVRPTAKAMALVPTKAVYRTHKRPKPAKPRIVRKKLAPKKEQCRYIVRDLSMPGSNVIYCMPSKAY